MRNRVALVLSLSVLVLVGSSSTAQGSIGHRFFGVWYGLESLSSQDLNRMDQGRVGMVRWPFYWNRAEPSPGNFEWTVSDRIVGDLASKGIRVLPIVYASPAYISDDYRVPPLKSQSDRQYWKQFLREAVRRYGPGGEYWTNPGLYLAQHPLAKPVPIRAWQVWNEPNLPHYFLAKPPVRKYAELVRISHAAIKGEDPKAKVVLAGMPPYAAGIHTWRFLDRFYRVPGIKRMFDFAALHPYAPTIRLVRQAIVKTRKAMKRHGDGHTPLWISEIGWGSAHGGGDLNRGLHGQARMLKRSFRLIKRHRRAWRIKGVIWYIWRDPGSASDCGSTFCESAGLFRYGGSSKPAWRAFKHFTGAG
jgi:hypothetical protein